MQQQKAEIMQMQSISQRKLGRRYFKTKSSASIISVRATPTACLALGPHHVHGLVSAIRALWRGSSGSSFFKSKMLCKSENALSLRDHNAELTKYDTMLVKDGRFVGDAARSTAMLQ